jgi:hypothetical protein
VTGGSFLFSDGQVHHDTHAVPMGNNVTRRLGNYVLTSRPCLGNYVIADSRWREPGPEPVNLNEAPSAGFY